MERYNNRWVLGDQEMDLIVDVANTKADLAGFAQTCLRHEFCPIKIEGKPVAGWNRPYWTQTVDEYNPDDLDAIVAAYMAAGLIDEAKTYAFLVYQLYGEDYMILQETIAKIVKVFDWWRCQMSFINWSENEGHYALSGSSLLQAPRGFVGGVWYNAPYDAWNKGVKGEVNKVIIDSEEDVDGTETFSVEVDLDNHGRKDQYVLWTDLDETEADKRKEWIEEVLYEYHFKDTLFVFDCKNLTFTDDYGQVLRSYR